MLIISFEDREYALDKAKITVDEWRELKRKYGMTPKKWDETIGEADPDASTFIYWVMLRQSGAQNIPLGDQLKPDIIALNSAIAAALVTEAEVAEQEEGEADPTPDGSLPDTRTRRSPGSGTETSAPSATSTSSRLPGTSISEPPV